MEEVKESDVITDGVKRGLTIDQTPDLAPLNLSASIIDHNSPSISMFASTLDIPRPPKRKVNDTSQDDTIDLSQETTLRLETT